MKHKIEVKHSCIEINNYNPNDCYRLEEIFSVYDKITHSSSIVCLQYIAEERKLIVPRGIDISFLENLIGAPAYLNTHHDKMDSLDTIHLKSIPRDDVQKEAIAFMLGENKYYNNKVKSQLSVNLTTGKGKTYISIFVSSYLKLRSMVITSSISWLEQWRDCILEYTDTKPNEIYMLIGTPAVHRLLKKDISQYKFILASIDTIKSYGDRNGWDKVTELFKYTKIGLKFYDEAHLNFDAMSRIDAYTNTFRTYYVTATPIRSDQDENVIYKYYFKNVPAIDLFHEENDPHTNVIVIRYNSHPDPIDISNCKNPYGFDRNKYCGYIVNRPNYYKILHVLIDLVLKNKSKNVFYIATNNSIEITRQWIVANYPELYTDIGVFTSVITDNKEEQLNKALILSTTKSLGAAVDIKGLKMVAVVAEPFKSEVITRQTLGRTRDDNTYYIEIVDEGFEPIRRYSKEKKAIYEKYGCSLTEIKLSDIELDERVYKILQSRQVMLDSMRMLQVISFVNNSILIEPIYFNRQLIEPISFMNKG